MAVSLNKCYRLVRCRVASLYRYCDPTAFITSMSPRTRCGHQDPDLFHELAKLLQSYVRVPKGTFSSLAYSSLDSSFGSKMPSDLRTSYLQVFSVHSARPPKQLEHPRHWVLQLRCGQDYWVFQQCLKHRLRQLFVFVPSNLPLSFCEASQAGGIRKDLGMRTRAWAEISAILG